MGRKSRRKAKAGEASGRKPARAPSRAPAHPGAPTGSHRAEAGDEDGLIPRRWTGLSTSRLAGIVAALAFAVFAISVGNDFVYDDVDMIRDDDRLDAPLDLATFFTTSYWGEAARDSNLYRPLTVWSFALDRAILGARPFGTHLVNVLANAAVSMLVFLFLLRLTGRRGLALLTALLFAVHPVHAEVVANGVGRSELGAAGFLLAAGLYHLRWIEARGDRDSGRRLLPALALYLVALLFKESAAVLPGLLFLGEWLLVQRGRLGRALGHAGAYLAYAIPLGAYLVARSLVVGTSLPAIQEVMAGATPTERVLFASEVLLRNLGQLVVPWRLLGEYSDYRSPVDSSLLDPLVLLSLAAWVVLAVLAVRMHRAGRRLLPYGLAWFFLAVLPASNLLFPVGTVRAERLLYVPSLGVLLVLAWLLAELSRRRPEAARALAVAVLLAYGLRSAARSRDWRSEESFWTATVRDNPGSAIAWSSHANMLRDDGRLEEAEAAYRTAIELRDGSGFFYPEAHSGLAGVLEKTGRPEEAVAEYRLVVEREPEHHSAVMNLGVLLLGDPASLPEAIELLERATEMRPDDFRAPANLAEAWRQSGRPDRSLEAIEEAIERDPSIADLHLVRAETLEALGRDEEAARARAEGMRLRRGGGP